MGALPGAEKGVFPGRWRFEKTMAALTMAAGCPRNQFDPSDWHDILDHLAPGRRAWRFLYHRAEVLAGTPGFFPSANAWRQAVLECYAWGQRRRGDDE
jgi:hypothetical protein